MNRVMLFQIVTKIIHNVQNVSGLDVLENISQMIDNIIDQKTFIRRNNYIIHTAE